MRCFYIASSAGRTRNPLHCHRFWQQLKGQPVEFTWQSDDGISLVAVLRTGPTESLIQGLHQSVFRAEKRIGLSAADGMAGASLVFCGT